MFTIIWDKLVNILIDQLNTKKFKDHNRGEYEIKNDSHSIMFFLGFFGIHRFYLGYTKIGIIQFLTGGGFVIWALVDFLRLFTGSLGPEGSVWKGGSILKPLFLETLYYQRFLRISNN